MRPGGAVHTKRVLVVVPALNEAATVRVVVERLSSVGYDVLIIDDGSTDDTAVIAAAAGARVLSLPINLGIGGALRLGFRDAIARGYEVVVQCDADGQHDPGQIATLLHAMDEQDLDMVIGSRFTGGGYEVGTTRRLTMRLFAQIATSATGVPLSDATSGFRAIRDPLLSRFARTYSAEYLVENVEALVQAGRHGFRVGEVPVTMAQRQGGDASTAPVKAAWYSLRALVLLAVLWTPTRGQRQRS